MNTQRAETWPSTHAHEQTEHVQRHMCKEPTPTCLLRHRAEPTRHLELLPSMLAYARAVGLGGSTSPTSLAWQPHNEPLSHASPPPPGSHPCSSVRWRCTRRATVSARAPHRSTPWTAIVCIGSVLDGLQRCYRTHTHTVAQVDGTALPPVHRVVVPNVHMLT